MESRESSTGTEQKLSGPWAQKALSLLGYCSLPASSLALSPHIASLSFQEPEPSSGSRLRLWLQLLLYPRRGVGLTLKGQGGQVRSS